MADPITLGGALVGYFIVNAPAATSELAAIHPTLVWGVGLLSSAVTVGFLPGSSPGHGIVRIPC